MSLTQNQTVFLDCFSVHMQTFHMKRCFYSLSQNNKTSHTAINTLQSVNVKWWFKQRKNGSSPLKAAERPEKRGRFCVVTTLHVIFEHSGMADRISPSGTWTADSCWLTKSRLVQKVLHSFPLTIFLHLLLHSPVMRGIPERAKGGARWLSHRSGGTLEVKGGRHGDTCLPTSQV